MPIQLTDKIFAK